LSKFIPPCLAGHDLLPNYFNIFPLILEVYRSVTSWPDILTLKQTQHQWCWVNAISLWYSVCP